MQIHKSGIVPSDAFITAHLYTLGQLNALLGVKLLMLEVPIWWLATIVGISVHKMVDVAISISTVQKYRMMLVGTYLIRSYAKNKSVDTEVFEWEVLGKIVALSSEMGSAR